MKEFVYFVMATALLCGCGKDADKKVTGSIYGIILDRATTEPVRGAGVSLSPVGATTVTGDEGQYEFTDLKAGEYIIGVTATGYVTLTEYKITVEAGKTNKGDVKLEKLPSSLRIVNDSKQDIHALDFSSDLSSLQFNIFNDTPAAFDWTIIITENCDWITASPMSGRVAVNATVPVTVAIDRTKLSEGMNTGSIHVSSVSSGSKTLTITAPGKGLPVLITGEATNKTNASATFNGEITDAGNPACTERGFVYSSDFSMPTTENTIALATADVTSSLTFTANVINLAAHTVYYVRAYAKNTLGTAYGNVISFITGTSAPEVMVSAATDVGASSATLNATITNSGSPAYDERGFCYNKTGNPTTSDTKQAVPGTGTESYLFHIEGLDYPSTYFVRAYVIQNGTPVYSATSINFTTARTNAEVSTLSPIHIAASSARLRGSVINAGDPAYSERGFCYNKTGNPTVSDKVVVSGAGVGDYTKDISDLDYETTYYVCSYVLQDGNPIYGNTEAFSTVWIETDISTYAPTGIEANACIFHGNLNHMGQPPCSEYGFVYSATHTSPTTADSRITLTGYATAYSANVTGLISNQTYYVRAYAIQPGDPNPVYGSAVQFTTGTPPVVQTLAISGVTRINHINGTWSLFADLNGNVTNAGNPAFVQRGFVYKEEDLLYNTPPMYEQDIVVTVPTTGTGAYTTVTQQLSHMEWYVARAFVKTASGQIYYGGAVTFDTWKYTEY
jgi:hypothetical protein